MASGVLLRSVFLVPFALVIAAAQGLTSDAEAKIAPLFENARAAERAGDFAKAADLYGDILRLAPSLAEVWTNKGLVLLQLNRHGEALAAFEKARALKPRLAIPHLFAGIEYLRTNRGPEGVAELRKAVELDPGNTKALWELGRAYMDSGSYDQAAPVLTRLVAKDANATDARFMLALAYLKWSRDTAKKLVAGPSPYGRLLKADAEAVAGFREAAEADSRIGLSHLTAPARAEVAWDASSFRILPGPPQADTATPEWTGLAPGESDLATAAARAWRAGRYGRALAAATLASRRSPDARATFWLSLTCRALSREILAQALEKDPESARAHLVTAQMAKEDGDNDRASAELEKAIAADPHNAEVRLVYIQFLAGLSKEQALPRMREAAAAFPQDATINSELGKALLKTGAHEEALQAFGKALAADPNSTAAHAGLADAKAGLGRLEEAIQEMRKALPGDQDGSLHYRIGRWYRETGHAAEARAAFDETARLKAKTLAATTGRLAGPAAR